MTNDTIVANKHYKYAHIFLHNSLGNNLNLINMICDSNNGFDMDDQLFVTGFKPLYDTVQHRCHIEYFATSSIQEDEMNMVNIYGDRADWLIVHSFPGGAGAQQRIFKIDKKLLKKIIWRTWGHDVPSAHRLVFFHSDYFIKNILLKFYSIAVYMWKIPEFTAGKKRLQKLYAVGIGNVVDTINIKETFGITKTFFMPYPSPNEYPALESLSNASYDDGCYHVLIGHSGIGTDRHCEVLDVLQHYEHEKIMLHLVLSYGNPQYVARVKEYAVETWHGRIEIFEDTVEFAKYAEYVNKMDAVILDGLPSCALGNLCMILYMRKKLFLNRGGVLWKGLVADQIPFHYTDEISNMSFVEFIAKEEYTVPKESTLYYKPYDKYVNDWKMIFEELEAVKRD